MTAISKRLAQIVRKELSKNIIPVKTADGILVGEILIVTDGTLKSLWKNNELIYKEIHLNSIAIKMANVLALRSGSIYVDDIYKADQEYGRWFVDSQMLRTQYQKSLNNKEYDRADILWARYVESRHRTESTKLRAESLIKN
jgi:hypothetical protein